MLLFIRPECIYYPSSLPKALLATLQFGTIYTNIYYTQIQKKHRHLVHIVLNFKSDAEHIYDIFKSVTTFCITVTFCFTVQKNN